VSVTGGAGGGVGLTNGGTTGDVAFDLAPVITWLFLTDCLVSLAPSEEPPRAPLFLISVSINPFPAIFIFVRLLFLVMLRLLFPFHLHLGHLIIYQLILRLSYQGNLLLLHLQVVLVEFHYLYFQERHHYL